jgi:hypothetical protein
MRRDTFVSKGLHRANHIKLAVDISQKPMHKDSRSKLQDCCNTDIYQNILEYIAHNFPGYSIGHLKSIDYGEDLDYNDGVHNVIQYIQLNKENLKTVNVVSDNYHGEYFDSEYTEIFQTE